MTTQELHDEKVRDLAEQYRQKGYEVVLESLPEVIPGFDQNLRPDLLAKKDRDQIVIEVKSRSALRNSDTVRRMADALAKTPEWRFELVVLEDAGMNLGTAVDTKTIQAQLVSAELLLEHNQHSSAFIVIWAALEGALRKLAAAQNISLGDASPTRLIRELSFNGLLSREDYEFLTQQLQSRNRIVHGFDAPSLTVGDIKALHDLILRLVDSTADQPAAA